MAVTFHLRAETKPLEHRSALTPSTTRSLVDAGHVVNAERSPERIFEDAEFEAAGATLVEAGSWKDAPRDHLIIGLKELPDEDDFPLVHEHISFMHVYKGQAGWEKILSRFPRGGGTLYDLEFLEDENKRRVAAFGYHAGYAGAALGLIAWAHQLQHPNLPLGSLSSYPNDEALIKDVKAGISAARLHSPSSPLPRVLIIGALGRCGRGAVDACVKAGLPESNILKWDMAETAHGGPFPEVASSDIFINCIYLTSRIPPFVTMDSLKAAGEERRLRVVVDVSCDPTSSLNPVPIYESWSTFKEPTLPVQLEQGPSLNVVAIDHLPSLLPRESSEAFSKALLPSLLLIDKRRDPAAAPVWTGAKDLFDKKVSELPK